MARKYAFQQELEGNYSEAFRLYEQARMAVTDQRSALNDLRNEDHNM